MQADLCRPACRHVHRLLRLAHIRLRRKEQADPVSAPSPYNADCRCLHYCKT